jgi:hypothetical protein
LGDVKIACLQKVSCAEPQGKLAFIKAKGMSSDDCAAEPECALLRKCRKQGAGRCIGSRKAFGQQNADQAYARALRVAAS